MHLHNHKSRQVPTLLAHMKQLHIYLLCTETGVPSTVKGDLHERYYLTTYAWIKEMGKMGTSSLASNVITAFPANSGGRCSIPMESFRSAAEDHMNSRLRWGLHSAHGLQWQLQHITVSGLLRSLHQGVIFAIVLVTTDDADALVFAVAPLRVLAPD